MFIKDSETIIGKIESNFQSSLTALPRVTTGGELKQIGDVVTYYTGVPFPVCNGVISSRINESNLNQTIQEIQNYFRTKKVPMFWWIFPSDKPSNLGVELEHHGFVKADEVPGMAVELEDVSDEMTILPGVEIVKAENLETITIWSKVLVEGYGLPQFLAESLAETSLKINEQKVGLQFNYLALLKGRPVGTSSVYLTEDGVAGIYSVATLEDARKRGIGQALTLLPLIEAKKLGYNLGILGSSEMGYRMYQSLGFKEYCKISQYMET